MDLVFKVRVACFPLSSIANQCYEKCIDKSKKDGELSVGENSCIDRCVQKYWQVSRARAQACMCARERGERIV